MDLYFCPRPGPVAEEHRPRTKHHWHYLRLNKKRKNLKHHRHYPRSYEPYSRATAAADFTVTAIAVRPGQRVALWGEIWATVAGGGHSAVPQRGRNAGGATQTECWIVPCQYALPVQVQPTPLPRPGDKYFFSRVSSARLNLSLEKKKKKRGRRGRKKKSERKQNRDKSFWQKYLTNFLLRILNHFSKGATHSKPLWETR